MNRAEAKKRLLGVFSTWRMFQKWLKDWMPGNHESFVDEVLNALGFNEEETQLPEEVDFDPNGIALAPGDYSSSEVARALNTVIRYLREREEDV